MKHLLLLAGKIVFAVVITMILSSCGNISANNLNKGHNNLSASDDDSDDMKKMKDSLLLSLPECNMATTN